MRNEKLTDSEIADLRAAKIERDRWKWLWNMLRRVALWTVALVAGLHALIDKGEALLKWLQQKP